MEPFHPHPARALIENMIERRLQPGADLDGIDAEIWSQFGEDWAVLYTDLVGFSRKVEAFGIIHFLQIIYESRRLFGPAIARFDGQVLKEEGDSLMIIFRDPCAALNSVLAMHEAARLYSADKSDEDRIELCAGLGWGRVLKIGDVDVFGAEINAACKLGEDTAARGETLVTAAFADAIAGKGDWRCSARAVEWMAERPAYLVEAGI